MSDSPLIPDLIELANTVGEKLLTWPELRSILGLSRHVFHGHYAAHLPDPIFVRQGNAVVKRWLPSDIRQWILSAHPSTTRFPGLQRQQSALEALDIQVPQLPRRALYAPMERRPPPRAKQILKDQNTKPADDAALTSPGPTIVHPSNAHLVFRKP